MKINSLRYKRYVFYTMLIVLIIIDIASINYFSRLLYISNQYMHSNRYETIKNFQSLLQSYADEYSNSDVMVKIRQHEITDFLKSSDCNHFAIFDNDLVKVISSGDYEITMNDYMILKRINESNIDARHYLEDYDSYYIKVTNSREPLLMIMRFKTDMSLTQSRIRAYFIFKIMIMLSIIIVGIMLVRALEEPLKNISYIARKLGLSLDSDNSEHITGVFRDSIEEIAEIGQNERIRADEVKRRMEGTEKRIVKREGLQQLSNMSSGLAHQINNNLASLKGMLELAKQHNDMDKVQLAHNEIDRLILLTSKFMAFSKQGEVYKERISPVNIIKAQARRTGIKLVINTHSDEFTVFTDPILMEELFFNIFDNIKRYADSDTAEVQVKDLPGVYKIHICDRGPGFPEEIIQNPYKPFQESAKGFGLGIPTVMKISNMIDIDIELINGANGADILLTMEKNEEDSTC